MKNGKLIAFILGILFIVILSYIVSTPTNTSENKKIQVVTSFYPMYFFASEIGRDKADVVNITPAGSEPHDYEPTTQQLVKITASNLLILNGGKLEAWGDKIKDQLEGTNVHIIVAGDNLANKQNPHVWLDPVLAKQEAKNIEKGYEKADPQNTAFYQENLKTLEGKLDQLDTDFKNGLSSCPKKDFVTSHEAFGYLAARYGLNQVAISGVSPDEEPSAQKLAEIADFVRKESIKVIFFESLVSPKLSQTIAQETEAKTMVLDPIEGGSNYLTAMRQNLANLKVALQCNK